jgi:hypothetical protein
MFMSLSLDRAQVFDVLPLLRNPAVCYDRDPQQRAALKAAHTMERRAATISMIDLAQAWLEELRITPEPDEMPVSGAVVLMNFTHPPEDQWVFIKAAVDSAQSDDELGHIAAGPLEHLLGHHGPAYIDEIEVLARRDAKFARTMKGVWQYSMTDDIWARVQAIQRATGPIEDG